jgi:hypothetical protein
MAMRRAFRLLLVLTCFCACFCATASAAAEEPAAHATFALVIGVNTSVDRGVAPLRYADDDAARYLDLFRALGARTYVLTRPDDNTRRLHPQAAAEALLPVHADFKRAVAALASDVEQARKRRVRTVVYFVYAGHGGVEDGKGYLTLEDARIDGAALDAEVVDAVGADQTHFIVDACDSYFLALGRGPGGERYESHGFSDLGGLRRRDSVGLLLSTSSARESHEWGGVQAGIFSHEVRSALYGAADADGDAQVSYREVSAFVERANAAIANERYRPDVYARAPKDSPILLDLRSRRHARIEVPGTHANHYYLEDAKGVRIADLHNAPNQSAYLMRPVRGGALYLHRLEDDAEYAIPAAPEAVAIADLEAGEPRTRARGAANDAFQSLFALPFGRATVESFALREPKPVEAERGSGARIRRYGGIALLGVSVAGLAGGAFTLASARDARASVGASSSQADAAAANDRIRARNTLAGVEIGVAGAALSGGLLLLLWPEAAAHVDVAASPSAGGSIFMGPSNRLRAPLVFLALAASGCVPVADEADARAPARAAGVTCVARPRIRVFRNPKYAPPWTRGAPPDGHANDEGGNGKDGGRQDASPADAGGPTCGAVPSRSRASRSTTATRVASIAMASVVSWGFAAATESIAPPVRGRALAFDGDRDGGDAGGSYVRVMDSADAGEHACTGECRPVPAQFTSAITIAVYLRLTGMQPFAHILGQWYGSDSYMLMTEGDDAGQRMELAVQTSDADAGPITITAPVAVDTWIHWVATYGGGHAASIATARSSPTRSRRTRPFDAPTCHWSWARSAAKARAAAISIMPIGAGDERLTSL